MHHKFIVLRGDDHKQATKLSPASRGMRRQLMEDLTLPQCSHRKVSPKRQGYRPSYNLVFHLQTHFKASESYFLDTVRIRFSQILKKMIEKNVKT